MRRADAISLKAAHETLQGGPMANREQRGNREAKKPKHKKQKAAHHSATGFLAAIAEGAPIPSSPRRK